MAPGAPAPKDDELVHIPPTMEDLEKSELHPKMKEAIRRGHDLFVNTQQLRGENVFNNMNCASCHLGEGRLPFAGPVWPAAVDLPAYRGKEAYKVNCAICHAEDGGGQVDGDAIIFPALWGDDSYNWGAGISRIFTLASFTKSNMPLGQPNSLSEQDAWDIAQYINSQERPQDVRYTGDIKETRAKFSDTFHKHTMYGQEFNGKILADHDNVGRKDFLKPDILRSRDFTGGKKPE